MKKRKVLACLLAAAMAVGNLSLSGVQAAKETVADGYEIDMEDLPKVTFGQHKDWEALYQAAWDSHKNNIKKINSALNPEATAKGDAWYVDEAFDETIFQWDTLFMMMFDKYGLHQFPTLNSMDNFYVNQVDSDGDDNGYICRRINESNGAMAYSNYMTVDAINPPMFGWAEWEQYQVHGDISRFTKVIKGKTILQRLDAYFQFLKRTRTHKDGAWAGLYVSNGQGNGLDNTPNQAWDGWGQAANDMSIQQIQAADYIRKIAEEVVEKDASLSEEERTAYAELAEKYEQEEAQLKALVQEKMWSSEDSFYYNLDENGNFTSIATPTGLWSLAAGLPSKEQADQMIENFALNSEKMFRPNGLSTVCYDYSTFKSTGGYWNGAMWSPTSYQWIKGLQNYGYEELAFQEAVRHIDALTDVYQLGAKDRYGNLLYTLWENYSSEYSIPGSTEYSDTQPSRSNFVGWTGALAIASMIEDVIGVTLDAPNNTVNWNINLTEEHGIRDLYMNVPGKGENRISLIAEERSSSSAPVSLEVQCDKDFTLKVSRDGEEETISVGAGIHTYRLGGTEGEEPYLGLAARDFELYGLTAEDFTEAEDYVYFTAQEDETIQDGLKCQVGGEADFIYNVNTVGCPAKSSLNPVTYRENEELADLSLAGAQDCVRESYELGNDGFMFMAPADQTMRTLKAVVGVQGGEAVIQAGISDASSRRVSQVLKGGKEEKVYVVEIPYRASGEGQNLLVEYTITSKEGNISLKGILAEKGGYEIGAAPENLQVESGNTALFVSAQDPEGMDYDSYRIYAGPALEQLSVYETEALPFEITGLENYTRYWVKVAGVKDGVEGQASDTVTQIPEEIARSEKARAFSDWEAVATEVLNGNAGFDQIEKNLNFDVSGPIYGSRISITSSTAGEKYGVMDNGTVVWPVQPMKDQQVDLTVEITQEDTTITVEQPAVVKAKSQEEVPYVSGTKTERTEGEVNLTEEGSKDWVQFTNSNVDTYAKKAGEAWITDIKATGAFSQASDAPFTFQASDAGTIKPVNHRSVIVKGEGNGYSFSLPYSEKMQHAAVYAAVWGGDVTVEMAVNGAVMYSGTFGKDTSNGMTGQCFDLAYKTPDKEDQVTVRVYCSKNLDEQWGGCSVGLQAVTLWETEEEVPSPEIPEESVLDMKLTAQPQAADLTAEGSIDWLLFDRQNLEEMERKKTDHTAIAVDVLQSVTKISTDPADALLSYTDGTRQEAGTFRQASVFEQVGNGLVFTLPYSASKRTFRLYFGAWSERVELKAEILQDGQAVEEEILEFDTGNQSGGSPALYRVWKISYGGDEGDALRLTVKNVHSYDTRWGNVCVQAAALEEAFRVESVQNTKHGRIAVTRQKATPGTMVHVFAFPETGYVLREGSLCYSIDGEGSWPIVEESFQMPMGDVVITAEFEKAGTSEMSDLDTWIAFMESFQKEEYTRESWEALAEAIQAAKAVNANEEATRSDIDEARAALIAAFGNLEYGVQKQHLEAAIGAAEAILAVPGDYEEESLILLRESLAQAKEVLMDEDSSQDDVNAMAGQLLDALAQVSGNEDVGALENLIQAAERLTASKYTRKSWEALEAAILYAKGVAADSERETEDIQAAYKKLAEAIQGLEMKGNKAALASILEKAKEILEHADRYVTASISGLADAVEQAEAVYENEDAGQKEVNSAVEALTSVVVHVRLKGDVDRDGRVTTNDARELLNYHAELSDLTEEQKKSADVNSDQQVDTKDAVLILQYAAEKIAGF